MKAFFILVLLLTALSLSAMADIQVTYVGFNAEQEAAFEYAVSLWEPILQSSVPIKINARFQNIPGYVVVFVPNMILNFAASPMQNVWYCTALANAITWTELNPGEADMDFFIVPNPDHSWYYGLDLNCPANSYDFVSEMHKAIAYGLGYMPSFYIQSGYGSYGMLDPSVLGLTTSFPWEPMQNHAALYDTFVCNTSGQYLTNNSLFPNPSPALNAQLTGGNLRYNGTYGNLFGGGNQPTLYASSFNLARTARLLSSTYNGTENAPGVPTGAIGTIFRYPSPIVLGMLKDQGWALNLEQLCTPPANLSASVNNADVSLNWEIPVGDYVIHEISIRRDGVLIAVTDQVAGPYVDSDLAAGTYEYTIMAKYSMGMSPASNSVSAQVSTAVNDNNAPSITSMLSLSPNPVRGMAKLSLSLNSSSNTSIELFNLKGRKLQTIFTGMLGEGTHELNWNAAKDNLPSGVYLIKASHGQTNTFSKVLVLR